MKLRRIRQIAVGLVFGLTCAGTARSEEVRVQVNSESGRPVADAVVSLISPAVHAESAPGPFLLDQRNLTFVPHVLAIPVGATVRFLNQDNELHNVHSSASTQSFNFALTKAGVHVDQIFSESGTVPLGCDVHPHMRGFIVVLDTPFYGVSGADGLVTLTGVARGEYTLVLWRAGKVVREEPLSVTATVEKTLTVSVPQAAALPPAQAPGKPADGWAGTVARVQAKLAEARAHAEAGRTAEVVTAGQDAYFALFEAEGMETAVRENISARRAFEDEELFGAARESLSALSQGSAKPEAATQAVADLLSALAADARALTAQETASAPAEPTHVEPADLSTLAGVATDALAHIRAEFAGVTTLLAQGDRPGAAARIGDVYFAQFHRFEAGLAARYPTETAALERRFQDARGEILGGAPPADVEQRLAALATDIDLQIVRLRAESSGPALVFLSSFLIIVREGFEALIVVSAILAFMARSGRRDMARAVHLGVASAVAASLLVAFGFRTLLASSPASREAMEGITMLLAAAVLFYVSYWFIANAQLARWNRFVQGQVKGSLVRGSLWSLGLVAFLAVFREGAETVLFYEALAAGSGGWTVPVVGGLLVGSGALGLIYLVFRYASFKLPLKLLFTGTSSLLYVMAFIMAGKGIAELQEAGWIGVTALPHLPSVSFLGIYPTVQTAALQAAFLGAGVIGLAAMRLLSARTAAPKPAPEPVGAASSQ